MNYITGMRYIFFICLFLFVQPAAFIQEPPVEVKVSKDIVMIGGKKYFIHTVEKGQTLFSISKAYQVSQQAIESENPLTAAGLKTGMALKIPAVSADNSKLAEEYSYHKLKKGETVYALSVRYGIPMETLIKCNSDIDLNNTQDNQVIRIPRSGSASAKPAVPSGFLAHEVKRKETIYSISKQYGVTPEEIIESNSFLKEGELKAATTILIPLHKPADIVLPDTVRPAVTSPLQTDCSKPATDLSKEINVAVILSFYLYENFNPPKMTSMDSALVEDGNYPQQVPIEDFIYNQSVPAIDYYEGILMAVENLKLSGLSVNLYVYDCSNDTNMIRTILAREEMKKMNMIISQAPGQLLLQVSSFSKNNAIPLISALYDPDSMVYDNPYFFQVCPTPGTEVDRACRFIASQCDKNVLLVYSRTMYDYDLVTQFRRMLAKYSQISPCTPSFSYTEINYDSVPENVTHLLKANKTNLVIIPSERETMIGSVLSDLMTKNIEYPVKLFGLPGWQVFKTINPENFFDMEMVFYTPFYVDFDLASVKNLILHYHKFFGTELYRINHKGYNNTLLGYDVAGYFITAFSMFGKDLAPCLQKVTFKPYQTNFDFVNVGNGGGYENRTIHFFECSKDLTIHPLQLSSGPTKP